MAKKRPSERTQELAHAIMRHKRLYYAGKPEISDPAYDAMEEELRRLAPDHPVLHYVGTDVTSKTNPKVTHAVPMLSLQKVYEQDELLSWMKEHPLVGTWKIDGNALALVYEKGQLTLAKTRGNGRVGEDVTDKAQWVADIIPNLDEKLSVEIRGELYCSEHHFAQLVEEMLGRGLERPTSARNIVSGLLGRKSHVDLARYFNFLPFDVLENNGQRLFKTEMAKFKWLEEKGFALPRPALLNDEDAVKHYLIEVKHDMQESEIGLDGVVFTYNDMNLHEEFGATSHHPRYKMSFKWQGHTAIATIKEIFWSPSRLGIVTPVAVIDPVFLSGASISNITLHNAEHVKAYNLKPGDEIEIVRSGEVIPKFLEVKQSAPGTYTFPKECPSCKTPLEFDDVRLKCPNQTDCPTQQSGAILNWIRAVEIDDLSDKRLDNMIDAGLVESVPDLYRLTKEDLLTLPLMGDKMAEKLLKNIQGSRKLALARFLTGLGIAGTGLTSWEKIITEFQSLKAIQKASVEDIAAVEGFATKTATQIVEGLVAREPLIEELLGLGVKPFLEEHLKGNKSGVLAGKHIAITGALTRPRGEVEKLIKAAGGKPASSVSKNTFALVTNEPESTSSKMEKARQLNIPIWTEDHLMHVLDGATT